MRVLGKAIAGTLFLFAILFLAVILISKFLLQTAPFPKADLAVVIEEGDSAKSTKRFAAFAESMSSIDALCSFHYVTVEKAYEGLADDTYAAAVLLPNSLYDDIYQGVNTPVTILLPTESSRSSRVLSRLFCDVVSMVQTSESGTYACIYYLRETHSPLDRGDASDAIAFLYLRNILKRSGALDSCICSPTGTYHALEYYTASLILILALLYATSLTSLYTRENTAFEELLRSRGIRPLQRMGVQILTSTLCLFLMLLIPTLLLYAVCSITYFYDFSSLALFHDFYMEPTPATFGAFLAIALLLALLFQVLFAGMSRHHWGISIGLTGLVLLLLLSGIFLPPCYLPEEIAPLMNISPFSWIHALLLNTLF